MPSVTPPAWCIAVVLPALVRDKPASFFIPNYHIPKTFIHESLENINFQFNINSYTQSVYFFYIYVLHHLHYNCRLISINVVVEVFM